MTGGLIDSGPTAYQSNGAKLPQNRFGMAEDRVPSLWHRDLNPFMHNPIAIAPSDECPQGKKNTKPLMTGKEVFRKCGMQL